MINEIVCQQLVVTFTHFLWQATAVGLVAFGLASIMRKNSPTHRYVVHAFAMGSLPLIVVATFLFISRPRQNESHTNVSPALQLSLPTTEFPAKASGQSRTLQAGESVAQELTPNELASDTGSMNEPREPISLWAPWIVFAYCIGVAVCFFRLCIAFRGGGRLRSNSYIADEPALAHIVTQQAVRLGLKISPAIRFCNQVVAPTVVGIIKPTILLPPALMTGLDPLQLSAIISHELAHIRRHDLFVNLIQRVIESVLFFHPVVWLLSRQMNREREACCDDLALAAGHDKLLYAESLLKMAELSFGFKAGASRSTKFAMAAAGDKHSDFEHRIRRLLNPTFDSRTKLTRTGWLALLSAAIVLPALCLALQWPANAMEPQDDRSGQVTQAAVDEEPEPGKPQPKVDLATKLGRTIHDRMSAIDQLPKFYWESRNGTLSDFVLDNPSDDPLENLTRSLDAHGGIEKWYRYRAQFGWDEDHFVLATGDTDKYRSFNGEHATSAPNETDEDRRPRMY